jgi:hypothetical protein
VKRIENFRAGDGRTEENPELHHIAAAPRQNAVKFLYGAADQQANVSRHRQPQKWHEHDRCLLSENRLTNAFGIRENIGMLSIGRSKFIEQN